MPTCQEDPSLQPLILQIAKMKQLFLQGAELSFRYKKGIPSKSFRSRLLPFVHKHKRIFQRKETGFEAILTDPIQDSIDSIEKKDSIVVQKDQVLNATPSTKKY